MKKIDVYELGISFQYLDAEKKKFLSNVAGKGENKTTKLYLSVFGGVIESAERLNGKVWADFSEDMVDEALMSLNAKSPMTVLAYLTIIKDYLAATKSGDENTLKRGFAYTIELGKDDMPKYVNKTLEKYRYITQKEFNDMMDSDKIDAEGKAIIVLLYHGIKGVGFSEICNLVVSDIDFDNNSVSISGRSDDNKNVKMEERYIKFFKEAIDKNEFVVYDSKGTSDIKQLTPYEEYDFAGMKRYFVRRFAYRPKPWDRVADEQTIARKVKLACAGIENPYLDAQSIYNSGDAGRMIERFGEVIPTHKQWKEYRDETGSRISRMTSENACAVLIEKIKKGM